MSLPVRVLVADDHQVFRSGLARTLADSPRLQLVGEAADGLEAVRQALQLKPDVVLMDLKMPVLDGISATREILNEEPPPKVLVLTSFETDEYVLQALRAGAHGYLLKDSTPDAIVSAIVGVAEDHQVLAARAARAVVARLEDTAAPRVDVDGLTSRDIEILKLLAAGLTNKQIGRQLNLAEKTVRNRVSQIYQKLNVFDRAQATLYAVRKGLIDL
jgi:DNA-binding NarL/FixJ family response regulator